MNYLREEAEIYASTKTLRASLLGKFKRYFKDYGDLAVSENIFCMPSIAKELSKT